jgi:DNA-binding MarR family transcriptional regulator
VTETTVHADPRYQALIQLLRTADTLWNSSRLLFSRWNLGPSQFNVLNLLHEVPEGLSQIDLSRALLMHRSNVTGLVDRLEERKLVKRQGVPGDRRSYRVSLTAKGRQAMAEVLPLYYDAAERVWGKISADRALRLKSDLEQLCANAATIASEYQGLGLEGAHERILTGS